MDKKKKSTGHEPNHGNKINPEINPMDIDQPVIPENDPDLIPDDDPFESPPDEDPEPGEGP